MKRADGEYMDDAPEVTEDTDPAELQDYALRRTQNPIEKNGCTVYNYSSHVPDYDALEEKTAEIPDGEYIIPFQVTSGWSYIWSLIPNALRRNSDFLIYIAHEGYYSHYPNFYNGKLSKTLENINAAREISEEYNE